MAVVVQRLVQAELSGVLFTADPVTGSRAMMIGNAVYGLGEQLVSGEVNALSFTLQRPKGIYDGPADLGSEGNLGGTSPCEGARIPEEPRLTSLCSPIVSPW